MADSDEDIDETEEDESSEEEESDDDDEDDSEDDAEAERVAREKRLAKRNMDRGRRQAKRQLLKELGVSSLEEVKTQLTAKKGSGKSDADAEKAEADHKAAIDSASKRERSATKREVRAALKEALAEVVSRDNLEAATRLALSEVDFSEFDPDELEDDDFAAVYVEAIQEIAPALFASDENEEDDEERPRTRTVKAKRTSRDKKVPAKTVKATAKTNWAAYKASTSRSNWDK